MSFTDEQVHTLVAETRRHFEVIGEALREDLRLLAEGHAALRQELKQEIGSLRVDLRSEFSEVRSMISCRTRSSTGA